MPDHSTFSKNRHGRFRESDLFRRLFENVVARCIAEGLVGGERFAVDASIIRADANKQNATPIGRRRSWIWRPRRGRCGSISTRWMTWPFIEEGVEVAVRIGELPDSSLTGVRVGEVPGAWSWHRHATFP